MGACACAGTQTDMATAAQTARSFVFMNISSEDDEKHKGRMLWSLCDIDMSLSHDLAPCINRGNPLGYP